MLENAFSLLAGSLLLMLRIAPGGSFPRPLSREEEQDCLRRWAEGDWEARNRLVEHNLRLVAHIVKKYYAQSGEADDLLSIGTIGLIKGVSSYRADRGVRLATYASRCIENEILMHFRAQRKSAGDVSLSEALDTEDEDGNLSFLDVVAQEDDLAERVGLQELCRKLRQAVDTLLGEREAHQPLLCLPDREKGARKAARRTGRRELSRAGGRKGGLRCRLDCFLGQSVVG